MVQTIFYIAEVEDKMFGFVLMCRSFSAGEGDGAYLPVGRGEA